MAFRLTMRKAVRRTLRDVLRACGAARKNFELVISPFSISPANTGASVILAVLSVPLTTPWTVRVPVRRPSSTFVAVVRYSSGGRIIRAKLWSGVGERLALPVYIGETLPAGAAIEIWSVPNVVARLTSDWTLKIGLLEDPAFPCDQDGTDISTSICIPQTGSFVDFDDATSQCTA